MWGYQGPPPPGALLDLKIPFIDLLDLLDLLAFIRIYWHLLAVLGPKSVQRWQAGRPGPRGARARSVEREMPLTGLPAPARRARGAIYFLLDLLKSLKSTRNH